MLGGKLENTVKRREASLGVIGSGAREKTNISPVRVLLQVPFENCGCQ